MRIYNARKSQVSIPLTTTQRIVVPSLGTSESFLPNPRILSLIVTSFDYSDIALIVSGPNEMTMCSETPCCSGFVVNSLEEAIERFSTDTTASMKCAAKVIDPINEERLSEAKEVEKQELKEAAEAATEEAAPEPETIDESEIAEVQVEEAPAEEAPKKKSSKKKK